MLDEEKKAMLELNRFSNMTTYWKQEEYTNIEIDSYIKTVLNLIEKQSEEIKELKEDRKKYAEEYIHNNPWLYKQLNEVYILRKELEQKERKAYIKGTNDADELCNKKWKDKIKAKIEEVEQWELYNMKIPKLSTLDERLGAKIGIKYVLQSLLEKE